jgi:GDP-L-fucose synthase
MAKIFIAGHKGMVGSAICRQLVGAGDDVITATRKELDLTSQVQADEFFGNNKFDQVYLAAAKVGGIHANNTYPAEFIYQNLMIQNNVIHAAYKSGVVKLLFLGSSCIYPRLSKQPIDENELLNGYLEPTNEPYAIAKIAGIKMCESYNRQYGVDYRSVMPTNLYGPGDNFHPDNSHVIPGLIRRIHAAKEENLSEVVAWGTGSALREFLYVDDMAHASIYIMNLDAREYLKHTSVMSSHLNVGSGVDCSIRELTQTIAKVVGFRGNVVWDVSKPDGAPRKLLNVSRVTRLGWSASVGLHEGIEKSYDWYLHNH